MPKLDDDIDALFQLPLDRFIEGRKLLAARLKKAGQRAEAERVKLLTKPPVSAWTVNQLYWNHREPFDELMASGQRFRKAQASGKIAEMRDALNARTEALKELSDLATNLLEDADHNASLDTIRRVTSTLEAVSAYAQLPDATLGRLTRDIDPPGFESSFTGTAFTGTAGVSPATSKSKARPPKSKSETVEKKDPGEKVRQVKLAAAKVSLQNVRKSLTAAQAKAQSLESQQKKADAAVKDAEKSQREAEKERREAEVRLKRATSAAEAAARRAQTIRDEFEAAKETLDDAQRAVANSTKELESLFRSPK